VLLPVEPLTPYPIEGLKEALRAEKNTIRAHIIFATGDFNIALSTPPLDYREQEERRLQAGGAKHNKRNKKQQGADEERKRC